MKTSGDDSGRWLPFLGVVLFILRRGFNILTGESKSLRGFVQPLLTGVASFTSWLLLCWISFLSTVLDEGDDEAETRGVFLGVTLGLGVIILGEGEDEAAIRGVCLGVTLGLGVSAFLVGTVG